MSNTAFITVLFLSSTVTTAATSSSNPSSSSSSSSSASTSSTNKPKPLTLSDILDNLPTNSDPILQPLTKPKPSTALKPPKKLVDSTSFKTPQVHRKQYDPKYLNILTPQAIPFPSYIEPVKVLNSKSFVLGPEGNHVAILFHVPVTKDVARENREVDDIILILESYGFRVEVIREATYALCEKTMNTRIRERKATGEIIDTLAFFLASHGRGNASDRLNVYLHDGVELDSKMFAQWAFDLGAKNTFFFILTCFAEKFANGITFPVNTRGGIYWASSFDSKAYFDTFPVKYPDGTTVSEYHDTFTRAHFEVSFCLKGLTELEYPITFQHLWDMLKSAHSTADARSTFGSQSMWNGQEVPLLLKPEDDREALLQRGTLAGAWVLQSDNTVKLMPYPVAGRTSGGVTRITEVLQRQIDERELLRNGTLRAAIPYFFTGRDSSDDNSEVDEDPAPIHQRDPLQESEMNNTNGGGDSEPESSESNSEDSSASEPEAEKEIDLNTLEEAPRRIEEAKRIKAFNAKNGWACRRTCLNCARRLVSTKKRTTDAHRAMFNALGLMFYAVPTSADGKSCGPKTGCSSS